MSNRSARQQHVPTPHSFGARLRHEREQRKISIASIAESTKILGALLEGLEADDVSRWPTGLYRRAFMRAYATAIGLDPEPIVKEFLEKFPEPEESLATPAHAAAPPMPSRTAVRRAPAPRDEAAEANAWFADGTLVPSFWFRCFAAAVDLFALAVMGVVLFAVLGMFWAPFALATAAYYTGSILLLGNTPGVCLFADPQKRVRVYVAASSFVGVFR